MKSTMNARMNNDAKLESRKEYKPENNAIDMSAAIGSSLPTNKISDSYR